MGLFEHFPYTNFHELNLDWLLQTVKQLKAAWDSADLPALIAAEIQRLIDSGEIGEILDGSVEYKIIEIDCGTRAMSTGIIAPDGGFVLIDFGDEGAASHVVQTLRNNGAVTMRAAVLTHAHHDHVGVPSQIFPEFEKSADFAVYMPPRPSAAYASAEVLTMYDSFLNYCVSQGFSIINPGSGILYTVGGHMTRFYNTNITRYETIPYNYNDTSLCGSVNLGGVNFAFFGDIYPAAQAVVCGEDIGKNEIILAPHHGLGTGIDPEFLAKVQAGYIIGNFGSDYNSSNYPVSPLAWNSAIAAYCQEFGAGFYDTLENRDILFSVNQNGSIRTEAEPYNYPGEIATFASLRNVTNYVEDSATSSTGLKDLLTRMPENSRVHCYITGNYTIAADLGLPSGSSVYYILDVVKFTGGATNALYDRSDPGSFFFEIAVSPLREGSYTMRQLGTYRAGTDTWRLDREKADGLLVIDVATDGSITAEQGADDALYTVEAASVKFTRTGYYLALCTGQTSVGSGSGEVAGYTLNHGVPRVITITAGSQTFSNPGLASRYILKYMQGQELSTGWI